MPPDGAIPPAVDPSLNETSSTKLRNTELRGSTVPELPTINLSPDPSAVALRDRTPSTGMTPGRGRTLSEYWADTNPFFNARHTIDNSSSFSLPSREVPAVSASASGSSACPTPNSSFSGSTRSVAMSIDSAASRSRSRSVSGRCATPSCTAEDAAGAGRASSRPRDSLRRRDRRRAVHAALVQHHHAADLVVVGVVARRQPPPHDAATTDVDHPVVDGARRREGELPAAKLVRSSSSTTRAPPEKRRLSRDFDADTAGPWWRTATTPKGMGRRRRRGGSRCSRCWATRCTAARCVRWRRSSSS